MTALEYDRTYIWHPYASLKDPPPVRLVESASGTRIKISNGHELIDSVSSWWCVAHGHNRPEIVEAICKQSEKLSHVMFGGFTHEVAVTLAQKLAEFTPAGLNRVFFADSGSISVEVACKMAVQYHASLGHPERNKLVALKGAYHGDTSLCMAISDPDGMHTLFQGIMTKQFFAAKPGGADDIESLAQILERHKDEIAAVIMEPCFQAANAMNFYSPEYLSAARRLCDEYGALLIFDEIAAGFYRTGPLWAHENSGIKPDIMTVGKALTGGHITLAAAIASENVAATISAGTPSAFMHGPTYMANPLACAAAIASLELFEKNDYPAKVQEIERSLRRLEFLKGGSNIRDVRIKGAVAVIEVDHMPARHDIERVIDAHGVWLRPFANFIYAMPPLVSSKDDIERICGALEDLAKSEPGPDADDGDFHE